MRGLVPQGEVEAPAGTPALGGDAAGEVSLVQRVRGLLLSMLVMDRRMGLTMVMVCAWRQLAELPKMVEGVQSQDPTVQLEAVTKFRKLLSIGERRRLPCRCRRTDPH